MSKTYLSEHMLDWAVLSECLINQSVIRGDAIDGPVTIKLIPSMRPFQIDEIEQRDTIQGERTAVFEPHKAESGALRFQFDRLE